jgi:hypothetical protein
MRPLALVLLPLEVLHRHQVGLEVIEGLVVQKVLASLVVLHPCLALQDLALSLVRPLVQVLPVVLAPAFVQP